MDNLNEISSKAAKSPNTVVEFEDSVQASINEYTKKCAAHNVMEQLTIGASATVSVPEFTTKFLVMNYNNKLHELKNTDERPNKKISINRACFVPYIKIGDSAPHIFINKLHCEYGNDSAEYMYNLFATRVYNINNIFEELIELFSSSIGVSPFKVIKCVKTGIDNKCELKIIIIDGVPTILFPFDAELFRDELKMTVNSTYDLGEDNYLIVKHLQSIITTPSDNESLSFACDACDMNDCTKIYDHSPNLHKLINLYPQRLNPSSP